MKRYLFIIIVLLIGTNRVYAECTSEEIANLKKEADKIEITYKHLGKIETESVILTNQFEIKIKNIPDNVYIHETNFNTDYSADMILNGTLTEVYYTGNWTFEFYSNTCNQLLKTIKMKLPKYNEYSESELCEGIDGDDFKLCGKYYDYDVSYEMFEQRVKQYRAIHKIGIGEEEKKVEKDPFFNKVKALINDNILYIEIGGASLIVIVGIIIFMLSRKKRGVLK